VVQKRKGKTKALTFSKESSSSSKSLYVVKIINKIMRESSLCPPFPNGAHKTIWVVSLRFQHENKKGSGKKR
jgi:hypothetical protein